MKLIDTHAHLQFKAYDDDRDKVVARSSKGLAAVVNVGAKIDSSEEAVRLAKKIPNFYAAVGIHPHHADEWQKDWIKKLEELAKEPKVVAIGEIGLDNHKYEGSPKPNLAKQTKLLLEQIELAKKLDLPVIFHCRDAYDELYEVIKPYKKLEGLAHCFMGTSEQVKKFLNLGLYISFSGNITYKRNEYIREAAKIVPLNRMLVETDAPYLPPEPHRGKRNEPVYVKIVAETVARVKSENFEKTVETIHKNSIKLLKLV
jgi:TatD DNase family protein